jgi:hypothetical protein
VEEGVEELLGLCVVFVVVVDVIDAVSLIGGKIP